MNDEITPKKGRCIMSDAELKKEDAKNFYCQLLTKINSCCDKGNHINCDETKNYGTKEDRKEDREACRNKTSDNEKYLNQKCRNRTSNDNTKGCLFKELDEEICDGKKIRRYLKYVVPEWNDMTPSRLYKHIQKMHENAEEIRRFEIDLTWRRAIYFIPLVVIFFSAFGIAFFNFYYESDDLNGFISASADVNIDQTNTAGNIENKILLSKSVEKNSDKTIENIILIVIAFINACLCFLLTKMNVESQRWQNNWECHIDYLQQILGFKLMQTCLRRRGGYFSIRKSNTFIGFLAFLVWYFAMLALFASLLGIDFNFHPAYDNFLLGIYNYIWVAPIIGILFCINDIFYCLTWKHIFKEFGKNKEVKKVRESESRKFYIRELEKFVKEKDELIPPEDNNKKYFFLTISIFFIPFIFIIILYFIMKFSVTILAVILIMMVAIFVSCISVCIRNVMEDIYAIEKDSDESSNA